MAKRNNNRRSNLAELDIFSDSDAEIEQTEEDYRLEHTVAKSAIGTILQQFHYILENNCQTNDPGNPNTNFIDRCRKKCYTVPENVIPTLLLQIEKCRTANNKLILAEKQQEYSGIMIDLDIYQPVDISDSQITASHCHQFACTVITILKKYLDLTVNDQPLECIYIGFTKKPKLVLDTQKNAYKDGLHMIIPGIKVTRTFKHMLINELLNSTAYVNIMHGIKVANGLDCKSFIDKASAYVPVHFIGCLTKPSATAAYELFKVYKANIQQENSIIITEEIATFKQKSVNLSYEFSLNWERIPQKKAIITKYNYDVKPEHTMLYNRFKGNEREELSDADWMLNTYDCGKLSILMIQDPDTTHIKSLLDILNPRRAESYEEWFKVISALASQGKTYKPLAIYFSQKCSTKYNEADLNTRWRKLLKSPSRISIGSLYYWAKQDNKEQFDKIQQDNIYKTSYTTIFDQTVDGTLKHYDIAALLYKCLKHKYIFSKKDGDPNGIWYEFILDTDRHSKGEIYKWREYPKNNRPRSMSIYISEVLIDIFKQALISVKNKLKDEPSDMQKYYLKILSNLQRTCQNLKDVHFKRGVITEAEYLFEDNTFADSLDKDNNILGVGNGVLLLDGTPRLITGYHPYRVSKYTPVNYYPYNPHIHTQAEMLKTLRDLFPDDEPDSFEFMLSYFSSVVDGRPKESIMVLLVGGGSNGKSFLVELIKAVMGDRYAVKIPLTFLTTKANSADNATPALMMLQTARFAYYSESNHNETLNMAKIKEFTGNETMSGRQLYGTYINFKPKCHHLVGSNYMFDIMGSDHGTWRRLKLLKMKIKFVPRHESIDANNPLERPCNDQVVTWTDMDEYKEAYMSILVHYYNVLCKKYDGKVLNVPHHHLERDTMQFRNTQDTFNRFLYLHLVWSPDENTTLDTLSAVYLEWFGTRHIVRNDQRRIIMDTIENSCISKYIKKNDRGIPYLPGMRLLPPNDASTATLEDNEQFLFNRTDNPIEKRIKEECRVESTSMFYERICREFDADIVDQHITAAGEYIPLDECVYSRPLPSPKHHADEAPELDEYGIKKIQMPYSSAVDEYGITLDDILDM